MFHGPSLAYTIERACACACEKERLGGPLPARCLPVAAPPGATGRHGGGGAFTGRFGGGLPYALDLGDTVLPQPNRNFPYTL